VFYELCMTAIVKVCFGIEHLLTSLPIERIDYLQAVECRHIRIPLYLFGFYMGQVGPLEFDSRAQHFTISDLKRTMSPMTKKTLKCRVPKLGIWEWLKLCHNLLTCNGL